MAWLTCRESVHSQLQPQDVVVCGEVATTSCMDSNTVITLVSSVNYLFSTGEKGQLDVLEQPPDKGK